jgi:glycosyltransferase involved in cell wall biosynthesis
VQRGHDVTVYNPSTHPYSGDEWQGARIIRCYAPPGTAGQFLYDLACTLDARKRDFDIWLVLGYTSSSVWGWLYPKKKSVLISNMDGLEWKRSKYSSLVRKFLLWAERLAVQHSHFLVADSIAIQAYLENKYKVPAKYIAYGAEVYEDNGPAALAEFGLQSDDYFLVIARMEPENNIEMILQGYCSAGSKKKLLLVGNIDNAYGIKLQQQFGNRPGVLFTRPVYEQSKLTALKKYCSLYFHGHSCGGTNPSLLEAIAGSALLCAHDNAFNRAVLGEDALYFSSAEGVRTGINEMPGRDKANRMIANNLLKIQQQFNWPAIVAEYERFMQDCYNSMRR